MMRNFRSEHVTTGRLTVSIPDIWSVIGESCDKQKMDIADASSFGPDRRRAKAFWAVGRRRASYLVGGLKSEVCLPCH